MKISPKKYAQALFDSLKGKDDKESIIIIDLFIEMLYEDNQIALIRKIIYYFQALYEKEGLYSKVRIESAHKLSDKTKSEIKKYLQKKEIKGELKWEEIIDEKLKGGFILRYQDQILDLSLKTRLNNFSQFLIKK